MPDDDLPAAHPDALSEEDHARSETSVRDLVDEDLADRRTPSRRFELEDEAGGEHLEGFDVDLADWEDPDG
jgi:hypothetical protein